MAGVASPVPLCDGVRGPDGPACGIVPAGRATSAILSVSMRSDESESWRGLVAVFVDAGS
jgi:hypothetical protein